MYIYLKIHNTTGMKYLGYTSRNPYEYNGSGKYWKAHLDKHGLDITTTILFESDDKAEIERVALSYSKKYDIVKSKKFANLIEERGQGGHTLYPEWTDERRKKASESAKKKVFSEEHRKNIALRVSGEKNPFYGKNHTDESRAKMSTSSKGQIACNRKPITIDGIEYESQSELCRALKIGKAKARKLYNEQQQKLSMV